MPGRREVNGIRDLDAMASPNHCDVEGDVRGKRNHVETTKLAQSLSAVFAPAGPGCCYLWTT